MPQVPHAKQAYLKALAPKQRRKLAHASDGRCLPDLDEAPRNEGLRNGALVPRQLPMNMQASKSQCSSVNVRLSIRSGILMDSLAARLLPQCDTNNATSRSPGSRKDCCQSSQSSAEEL